MQILNSPFQAAVKPSYPLDPAELKTIIATTTCIHGFREIYLDFGQLAPETLRVIDGKNEVDAVIRVRVIMSKEHLAELKGAIEKVLPLLEEAQKNEK